MHNANVPLDRFLAINKKGNGILFVPWTSSSIYLYGSIDFTLNGGGYCKLHCFVLRCRFSLPFPKSLFAGLFMYGYPCSCETS